MKILHLCLVALFAALVLDSCTKEPVSQNINMTEDIKADSNDIINTPAGPYLRKQVHEIPAGSTITIQEGHLIRIDPKSGKTLQDFGEIEKSISGSPLNKNLVVNNIDLDQNSKMHSTLPGNYSSDGWLTNSYWTNTNSSPIGSFFTAWIVPSAPTAVFTTNPNINLNQVLYIFNGIEQTNASDIIQPVLQYGTNNAFGGNYWTISSWYIYGLTVLHSPPTTVVPGTYIYGFIYLTAINGSNYNYQISFENYPNSVLNISNVPIQPEAVLTLEGYNIHAANDFPVTPNVRLDDLEINLGLNTHNPATVNWSTNNPTANIEQSVVVTNNTPTVDGEVDIYFHGYDSRFNPAYSMGSPGTELEFAL